MGILDLGAGKDRYVECRQCGVAVEDTDASCPTCGGTDMAEYRL